MGYNQGKNNPMYGISNKHFLGRKHTEESKLKMRLARLNEKNPIWKGDKVGYGALHRWVVRHYPKTEFCQICNIVPPFDLANISGKYLRDLNDWEWLCRRCHMIKDGRMIKLGLTRRKNLAVVQ